MEADETIARDLVAEARATRAQHAALAVEGYELRERDGLLICALGFFEAARAWTELQGLVL